MLRHFSEPSAFSFSELDHHPLGLSQLFQCFTISLFDWSDKVVNQLSFEVLRQRQQSHFALLECDDLARVNHGWRSQVRVSVHKHPQKLQLRCKLLLEGLESGQVLFVAFRLGINVQNDLSLAWVNQLLVIKCELKSFELQEEVEQHFGHFCLIMEFKTQCPCSE